MKQMRILMGMPVIVEIVDGAVTFEIFDKVFDYFRYVDEKFSTYKKTSEITLVNEGKIPPEKYSSDFKLVLRLCEETKILTKGYFDIKRDGKIDPSGLVKGWAINNAAGILRDLGFANFYVDAGGDVQVCGEKSPGHQWRVGIRNPFAKEQIIKVLVVKDRGIATSGNYERGKHIYNPKNGLLVDEIASITVIGQNVYEADRFATAAFVMGKKGIEFIATLPGFEGYMIDKSGKAVFTNGFAHFFDAND